MAITFEIAIECGDSKADTARIAGHFAGWELRLLTGARVEVGAQTYADEEGHWWCRGYPGGCLHNWGSPERALEWNEAALRLYQRLQTAPPFRFAFVDNNAADGCWTWSELLDSACSASEVGEPLSFPGLVVRADCWVLLGSPATFVPFAPGYRWHPFEGRSHDGTTEARPLRWPDARGEALRGLLAQIERQAGG